MAASRMIARRGLVCVLIMALIAGLVPIFPEASHALAEEPEMELELDGAKRVSALEVVEPGIVPESVDDSVPEGNSRLLAQDLQAENTESEDPGRAFVQEHGREESEIPNGLGLAAQSLASFVVDNPSMVTDNTMVAGQVVTWDCVWFGSYPQSEVTSDDADYPILQNAEWDADNDTIVGNMRFRRISKEDATTSNYWPSASETYRYFRYEPIKWRVMSVSEGSAMVMSDKALDDQRYNNTNTFVPWETSSIRSWLNGYGTESNQPGNDFSSNSFASTAFTSDELNAVLQSYVRNADESYGDNSSGNDTEDKIYLLSRAEVYGESSAVYGFQANSPSAWDEARRCRATDFAHAMGAFVMNSMDYHNGCNWWLRSPGDLSYYTSWVGNNGGVYCAGDRIGSKTFAVRPVLTLDLSSPRVSYAGTIDSRGLINEYGFRYFCEGYDETKDKLGFQNPTMEMPLEYFSSFFSPAPALVLWAKFNNGDKGVCYGMANATASIFHQWPSTRDIVTADSKDGCMSVQEVDFINEIKEPDNESQISYVRTGLWAIPFCDFIRYNHIYQASPLRTSELFIGEDVSSIFDKVKHEIDMNVLGSIIEFRKGLFKSHSVLAVGYAEENGNRIIIIDDSNDVGRLHSITIKPDESWSCDYYSSTNYSSEEYGLGRRPTSMEPYGLLSAMSYLPRLPFTSPRDLLKWKYWGDLSQTDYGGDETGEKDYHPLDEGMCLISVKSEDYEMNCEEHNPLQRVEIAGDEGCETDTDDDLFWAPQDSHVSFSQLKSEKNRVAVANGSKIVAVDVSGGSLAKVEPMASGSKAKILTADNAIVTAEVQDVAEDASVSTLSVSGAAATGTASLDASGGDCVLDGLRDITLTFKNDDGATDEKLVPNEEGQALQISVDEEASRIDVVPVPAFRTQSLTLAGVIGVNFYVDLSPLTEEERESCRMSFLVCGREVEDSYDSDHVNAKGYYGFTCPISSVEMADEIAATLSWGDDKSVGKVYSVSEYFEAFEEHAGSLEPEMVALVRSLADYGHYVQPMLARTRGWEVGGDHAEISALNEWDGSEADEAEEASAVHEVSCELPDGCGVSLVTQSLVLDSGTDLCLYVTTEDGASVTSAKLSDGTVLSVEAVPDGRWRVTVPAIMAHELGRRWRVEIETSVGAAADVEASALSWVRAALTADAWRNDAVGRDAAASILRYAQAAEAYKALHP